MTPTEYIEMRKPIRNAIMQLKQAEVAMWQAANAAPLPANLRPAEADDIQRGAIIWYKHGDTGHFWQIVAAPLHYGDAFKAYEAEDTSRYGLHDAWIEVEEP